MSESPLLVRTIVCAYSREELPTSWLQVHRRFEHEVAKAGLRVRVRLDPLEELPETFEVMVVVPELLDRAEAVRGAALLLATTRQDAAAAAGGLVRELESGSEIYAERADPNDPLIKAYRGYQEL